MCAIAGCVGSRAASVPAEWLAGMAASLRHRGPDDHGFLQWDGENPPTCGRGLARGGTQVGLVHQRLSILDLSDAGWQPMMSRDGRFAIVFNGEIYNYVELREKLESAGHEFRSTGDTEVLLAAFTEWGEEAITQLVGMFAFAILDTSTRTLTLARDPFGIKPLYYTTWPGGFAFASEIKALLELPIVRRGAAPGTLHEYLRFGRFGGADGTFFDQIRQLPAGHSVSLSLDTLPDVNPRQYWAPPSRRGSDLTFDEARERLRELFLESIALHLRSDVPVGVALSGGIDSSAIVSAVRAVGGPDVDIRAFSFIAAGTSLSEERWVDLQTQASGTVTKKICPPPADLARDVDVLIRAQDEPFGSTSIYAQYRVFSLAADAGVKVMLDGQGADELLGGYQFYLWARVASLLREGNHTAALGLARAARTLPGAPTPSTALARGAWGALPPSARTTARRSIGRWSGGDRWLHREWFQARGLGAADYPSDRTLSDTLIRDLTRDALPGLLRYEDRNSMAFSIESRVPFLTPQIADLVFRLPESYLISRDGTSKCVFRAAMRGLVPDAILDRRDKIGFGTPEREWLHVLRTWVDDVLASADQRAIGCLDLAAVRHEWARVVEGRSAFGWHVWRWINLIRWVQLYDIDLADGS